MRENLIRQPFRLTPSPGGEGFGDALPMASPEEGFGDALPMASSEEGFGDALPMASPSGEAGAALAATDEVRILTEKVDSLAALVMAQNAVLERVAGVLAAQTVNRTQERAIKAAIGRRAKELCRREGLEPRDWTRPTPERMMAEAIRHTLRELTGARAAGDIPQRMYDAAMRHVTEWDYPGAIRRVRKEMKA